MLLVGHEHVMKIPEFHMSCMLIFLGLVLIFIGLFCEKSIKAHTVAYTMFP